MDSYKNLEVVLSKGGFEPFIRHIRFPHFKNLTSGLRLEFKFPISAIVGPNGSNKSSVLRAIACCPHNENLGDHWFSTDVDPIDNTGGRPRYIFGYIDNHSKKLVEVIQVRIFKANDPDYWEPSRPLVGDGMETLRPLPKGKSVPGRTQTRWSGITKHVEMMDFRSEISAFDKLFYHGSMTESVRGKKAKEHLRARSALLRRVINDNLTTLKPFKGKQEQIIENKILPTDQVHEISEIIGRQYSSIRLIRHKLFESNSYTAILETNDLIYSEAFAGSGEFAVTMLVHKVMQAPPKSLIILDEPEVSLHPGAQLKLMDFLAKITLTQQHQVFIGTHSKHIIERLPPSAIILLQQNTSSGRIVAQHNIKPNEAFFHLGLITQAKRKIFVEDELAKNIVKKALRIIGEAALNQFEVIPYPGGAKTIFSKCMPSLMQSGDTKAIYILDGDQRPAEPISHPDQIPEKDAEKIDSEILNLCGVSSKNIDLARDGGKDPNIQEKYNQLKRRYLAYALEHTHYLPSPTPEAFVWSNMPDDSLKKKCHNSELKKSFELLTRLEKGYIKSEPVNSGEILETQIRRLASISDDNPDIQNLVSLLKDFVE